MTNDLPPTQTYYAKSVANDSSMWFNFVTLVTSALAMPEVVALIPPEYLLKVIRWAMALIALGNLYIRVMHTRRPVAFISPGDAKATEVRTLTPKSER